MRASPGLGEKDPLELGLDSEERRVGVWPMVVPIRVDPGSSWWGPSRGLEGSEAGLAAGVKRGWCKWEGRS